MAIASLLYAISAYTTKASRADGGKNLWYIHVHLSLKGGLLKEQLMQKQPLPPANTLGKDMELYLQHREL